MLISYRYKYIYIAVPKTGTVSTESFLLENDPSLLRNRVIVNGKKKKVKAHATALEIKQIMGEEFDEFHKIAIVRMPLSKMVSSYFFYKNGKPITSGNHNPYPVYLRVALARIFPFSIWSIIYPYKSNQGHLSDENNVPLVDYVGRLGNLEQDLKRIMLEIGMDFSQAKFPHKNTSKHKKEYSNYLKFDIQTKIVQQKVKDDQDFVSKLLEKIV